MVDLIGQEVSRCKTVQEEEGAVEWRFRNGSRLILLGPKQLLELCLPGSLGFKTSMLVFCVYCTLTAHISRGLTSSTFSLPSCFSVGTVTLTSPDRVRCPISAPRSPLLHSVTFISLVYEFY